jgi:CARDB
MKRNALIVFCALATGLIAASTVGADASRSRLGSPMCVTALDPASRAISVTAVMRPVSSTTKMQLKFDLLSRAGSSRPFARVRGGDLNTWVTPKDPTLGQQPNDVWNLIKQVVDLKAPATYRFKVAFRWLGAHGKMLGTVVKTGPTCYQPELRPDLQVRTIGVKAIPGRPTVDEYIALIRNAGATATGPFQVQFSDGDVVKTRNVDDLAPHSSLTEHFVGPACSTATAKVTADPNDQVDDSNRANNSLNVVCSSSASKGVALQSAPRADAGTPLHSIGQ